MNTIASLFLTKVWALDIKVLKEIINIIGQQSMDQEPSQGEIQGRAPASGSQTQDFEIIDGVAWIPIYGIISKELSLFDRIFSIGGTLISEIRDNFLAALDNEKVKEIVLDIDSPGGTIDGVLDLSDMIFEARKKKPVIAHANGMMLSAAYWIGSAADKIYTGKSSEIGSIGVYTVLSDFSVRSHNAGIKTSIIKAGEFKTVGHPLQPLTEEDRQIIQEQIDRYFEFFTESVKRNRKMSDEQVNQVADGRSYLGQEAVLQGLADKIVGMKTLMPVKIEHRGIKSAAGARSAAPTSIREPVVSHEVAQPKEKIKETTGELTVEEQCKIDWEKDPSLRKEFKGSLESYTRYTRAVKGGTVKIARAPVIKTP